MSAFGEGNKLQYLTSSCAERMRTKVSEDIDLYFDEKSRWENAIPGWNVLTSKNIVKPDLSALTSEMSDVEAALLVHSQMKKLTPQQATDVRVWALLSLTDGFTYVRNRWFPVSKPKSDAMREKIVKKIEAHCFVTDTRSLMRDNGLSRLWWMAYIAYRIDAENQQEILELILHTQDIRLNLLDRPSFSMNKDILKAIVLRLKKSKEEEQKELFEREVFRDWMRRINQSGGQVLLDGLGEDITNLVEQAAVEALTTRSEKRSK